MMPNVKILQIIEQHWLDQVVDLAQEAVQTSGVYGRICKNDHWVQGERRCPICRERTREILQRAQLSNLQNLANSTDSVKALELFIRYQMGRKEGKGWKFTREKNESFGDIVINHLDKLWQWAQQIAQGHAADEIKAVHLWLIRLYCGFLSRWFVALKGEEQVESVEED